MLQKNQKQTEQHIVKTLLEQQQQQRQHPQHQQQQQQYNKMPPLEYATLSPTRVQYLHEQQKLTTTSFSHLPNCKYHAINQQQQPIPQQQPTPQQQQHHKSCQHSSPQQLHKHHHHHHHHHHHRQHHHHQQHEQQQHSQQQQQQPIYHHHTLNLQESKNRKRDYTIKTQHYKSSPEINRTATSPTTSTTTTTKTTTANKSQLWITLPLPVANKKGIRRCRSYYNSFEDLDAKTRAEKRVVASLKYLCACTGATLRNLSKKTKNLHATQQQFTFTYTKVNRIDVKRQFFILRKVLVISCFLLILPVCDNPHTLVC